MGLQAFTPLGNTITFAATSTAPAPIQAVSSTLGANQYLVTNASANTVILGWGTTAAQATASAVNITSTGNGVVLLSNSASTFSFPPNAWFTGYASGPSTVYVQPGDGS